MRAKFSALAPAAMLDITIKINDQEATDLILVHGVFIMFFLYIAIDIQL